MVINGDGSFMESDGGGTLYSDRVMVRSSYNYFMVTRILNSDVLLVYGDLMVTGDPGIVSW